MDYVLLWDTTNACTQNKSTHVRIGGDIDGQNRRYNKDTKPLHYCVLVLVLVLVEERILLLLAR
jgi:hypothetical protein